MKLQKKYIWLIAVICLITLLIIAKRKGWIGERSLPEVQVEKVSRRTIIETVSASGEIQPEVEVKISADVSGEIVELLVKEGQHVKKGEHLLTINPDLIKAAADRVSAALNQSKASLANARARENQVRAALTLAENNYNRTKKLYESKSVSDAEFDQVNSQYKSAQADMEAAKQNTIATEFSVKSAEASLKEANDNLNRTRIYAPTEGTISKLNVKPGERVVGTAQMSGTELLRIADMREMLVNAVVNENDIVRVHQNDTSTIEVEAFTGRKFKGVVTEIARSSLNSGSVANGASIGDKVVNFLVKIRIIRSSYQDLLDSTKSDYSPFFPGMNATVDIQTKIIRNAISVPIMAVTVRPATELTDSSASAKVENEVYDDKDLKEVVFMFDAGKVRLKEVKTGIQDNNFIQITEGLEDGQEVISGPYSAISRTLKNNIEVQRKSTLNKE